MSELVQIQGDRMCPSFALDNPLRRYFAPARRDVKLLGVGPGETVADLGTGVGFLLPELLARVGPHGKVYAVDIDEENVAIARKRVGGDPRVHFHVGSASSTTPFPSASVDRALSSLVLCCLVDKTGALAEAWRLLRPGGLLLASYPRVRGARLRRRRGPLGVSPDLWSGLVKELPWEELPAPPGRLVTRHLLRKPVAAASPPPAPPSAPRAEETPKN